MKSTEAMRVRCRELANPQGLSDDYDRAVNEILDDVDLLLAGNERLGKWMAAAVDDWQVCDEMKADIRAWFETWNPCPPKPEN